MKNNKINWSFPRFVVGNLPLSMLLLKEEQQPCFNKKVEDPRQKHSGMTPNFNNSAFTLIELLVVVLIIGILAAVALPQYQKTVMKSRMTELQLLARKMYDARKIYQLANGQGPVSFEDLDIQILDTIHPDNTGVAYNERIICNIWGGCFDKKDSPNLYLSVQGDPAQWKCCWSGENSKIKKLCQSYFPNGTYVPNAPQYGFENEQCIMTPL